MVILCPNVHDRGHSYPYGPKKKINGLQTGQNLIVHIGGHKMACIEGHDYKKNFPHLYIHRRSDFCPKMYWQEISLALYGGGLIHFWETTVWFPKYELSKKAPTPRSWDLSSRHLETIWWWDPLKKSGWHFFPLTLLMKRRESPLKYNFVQNPWIFACLQSSSKFLSSTKLLW